MKLVVALAVASALVVGSVYTLSSSAALAGGMRPAAATGRSLLSSDSSSSSSSSGDDDDDDDATHDYHGEHGACSPAAVAHAWVSAWNEGRYEALDTMYTPDALYYVNGQLSALTNGKPATVERNKCVKRRGRLEYHVGDVTTSGHTVAAASGTLLVQRAMTGAAVVFELDAATCRIETMRVFISTESEAYRQYASEFLCNCYPLLEELGQCTREEEPAPIDVEAIAERCTRAFSTGDANAYAACFADDVRVVVNGVRKPSAEYADAQTVRDTAFNGFTWSVSNDHTLAEGFTLHVVHSGTVTATGSGESADFQKYAVYKFDSAGIITEVHAAVNDAQMQMLFARVHDLPPQPQFWKSQAALNSLTQFAAELGFPSDFTDFIDASQTNFATWLPAALAQRDGYCLTRVVVTDAEVIHRVPSAHVDFAQVSVQLGDARGRANDVRAISDSLVYDELTGELTSTNNGLGHAIVDLHLGARVSRGQTSVTQARQSYASLFAAVHGANGELTPEYFRLRNELCALIS